MPLLFCYVIQQSFAKMWMDIQQILTYSTNVILESQLTLATKSTVKD